MSEKLKNFKEIAIDTLGFGVVVYPIYSGLNAIVGPETFVDSLKDEKTFYFTLGAMAGRVIFDVGKRVYLSKRDNS